MRSISSSETASAVRSSSFVVFGDECPAIRCACSSVPPFDRYAVMPVARNVWQHVDAGSPAADARRLNHGQHGPAPERPPAQTAGPVDALKQRRLHVLDAAGRRRDTPRPPPRPGGGPARPWRLPPFSCSRSHPRSPLPEVVLPPHPPCRTHPSRSCTPSRSAAPDPVSPTRVPVSIRSRSAPQSRPGVTHRRRAPSSRTCFGPPHRTRPGFTGQHLVDDQPVAERPDRGQVLLRPSARTPDASGCRPPRGAARSPAAPGRSSAPAPRQRTAPHAPPRTRPANRSRLAIAAARDAPGTASDRHAGPASTITAEQTPPGRARTPGARADAPRRPATGGQRLATSRPLPLADDRLEALVVDASAALTSSARTTFISCASFAPARPRTTSRRPRRVSRSRSSPSSCRMASGMASNHRGLAGIRREPLTSRRTSRFARAA